MDVTLSNRVRMRENLWEVTSSNGPDFVQPGRRLRTLQAKQAGTSEASNFDLQPDRRLQRVRIKLKRAKQVPEAKEASTTTCTL